MNWLWLAIGAQVIFGSAGVFDRLLLKRREIDPWPYTFWFGMLGVFSVFLLPFGFRMPTLIGFFLAIPAGVSFIAAVFFQYQALEHSEASEALPLIGVLSPIFTLTLASVFLQSRIGLAEGFGFAFLILGGLLLFFAERRRTRRTLLINAHLAAVCGAASLVLLKAVFAQSGFVAGFFLTRSLGALFVLALLVIPQLRRKIWRSAGHTAPRQKFLYFANRAYAGLGSVMLTGAVFLVTNPALVDATANIQYLALFFFAWLLARERFRGGTLWRKLVAAVLMFIGLLGVWVGQYAAGLPPVNPLRPMTWGVTFSQRFSEELGLDWRENFRAILDDLHPARVRLIAYWDQIEPEEGKFVFGDLDWQVTEARRHNTLVLLALGMKLPRWPECHFPGWAENLSPEARELALRPYLSAVINHYRDEKIIFMWQVENEPYLSFGTCPQRPASSIPQEVQFVKTLDAARPILVTDSGEIGEWVRSVRLGDVFGTSLYRKVYPRFGGRFTGIIKYPLSPEFFRVKEQFVRWITGDKTKRYLVAELQAEPWEPESLRVVPLDEQMRVFSPNFFVDTIEFAKRTGFEEYYLWGAEWWYWMKTKQQNSSYWDIAASVFRQ